MESYRVLFVLRVLVLRALYTHRIKLLSVCHIKKNIIFSEHDVSVLLMYSKFCNNYFHFLRIYVSVFLFHFGRAFIRANM